VLHRDIHPVGKGGIKRLPVAAFTGCYLGFFLLEGLKFAYAIPFFNLTGGSVLFMYNGIAFLILITFLMFRPQGLLGGRA
jgi:branched-subunit amino acid ABC-type transport system permease component